MLAGLDGVLFSDHALSEPEATAFVKFLRERRRPDLLHTETRKLKAKFQQLQDAGPSFLEEPSTGMRQLRAEARDLLVRAGAAAAWPDQHAQYDPARELSLFVFALHASPRTRAELPAELQAAPKVSEEVFAEFVAPYLVSVPDEFLTQTQAWLFADLVRREASMPMVYDLSTNFSWPKLKSEFTRYEELPKPLGLYLSAGLVLGQQPVACEGKCPDIGQECRSCMEKNNPGLGEAQVEQSRRFRRRVASWSASPNGLLKALASLARLPAAPAPPISSSPLATVPPGTLAVSESAAAQAEVEVEEHKQEAEQRELETEGSSTATTEAAPPQIPTIAEEEEQDPWTVVYSAQSWPAFQQYVRTALLSLREGNQVFEKVIGGGTLTTLQLSSKLGNELIESTERQPQAQRKEFVHRKLTLAENGFRFSWPPDAVEEIISMRRKRANVLPQSTFMPDNFLPVYTTSLFQVQHVWEVFAGTRKNQAAGPDNSACSIDEKVLWRILGNLISWYWESHGQDSEVDEGTATHLSELLTEYEAEISRLRYPAAGGEFVFFEDLRKAKSADLVFAALDQQRVLGRRFLRQGFREACAVPPPPVRSVEEELEEGLEEL